jgi:hypothetical protein
MLQLAVESCKPASPAEKHADKKDKHPTPSSAFWSAGSPSLSSLAPYAAVEYALSLKVSTTPFDPQPATRNPYSLPPLPESLL